MKLKFYLHIMAGLLLLGLAACQKDKELLQANLKINDPRSVDEVRTVFAQTLSKALTDEQLRRYIHARMQESYDTDYELVYIAEKGKVIYNDKTFADLLKSHADASVLERYGEDFFMTLTDVSPLLSIKMSEIRGIDINAWNVNQVIPVVPVLNERNGKWLLFQNGQKQEQPLRFRNEEEEDYYDDDDPEFEEPVIGIWDAEGYYLVRMDGMTSWGTHVDDHMPGKSDATNQEKSLCQSLLQSALDALERYFVDNDEYHLINHQTLLQLYLDCLGLGGDNGGEGNLCTEPCERDCETEDELLVDFKINGWNVFRNIRNQPFESRYVFHGDVLMVTRNTLNGAVAPFSLKAVTPQYRRGDLLDCSSRPCQGRWKTLNYRIWRDWDEEELGSPYKIAWAEVDPGRVTFGASLGLSSKFKVKIAGVETEITASLGFNLSYVGSDVVSLGDQSVFYCEPIMEENNTLSVTFRCN